MTSRSFDVIVIGAGTGGLTAAALLARRGRSVLVVERHAVAGGNATVFNRPGYQFDVGLHYLGDCGPDGMIPRILRAAGIHDITFRELDPSGFDTLVFPDFTFYLPRGIEAFRARLIERFPREAKGIDRYLAVLHGIRALQGLWGGGIGQAIRSVWQARTAIRFRNRTLEQFFDRHITDRRLRAVLAAQSGDYAEPPSRAALLAHAAVIEGYLMGAYYPQGGAQTISDRFVTAITGCGGEIRLRSTVTRILIERGRAVGVEFVDDDPTREIARGEKAHAPQIAHAPVVISDADIKHTLLELVPPDQLRTPTLERTRSYEMAHALGVVYLGVRRDLRAEGIRNTNFWVHPGYDPEAVYAAARAGRFDPDPPCFIFASTLRDPDNPRLAPPGHANIQLVSIVPAQPQAWGTTAGELASGAYRDNPAYVQTKDAFAARLIKTAERALPGLSGAIVFQEVASPLTHSRFTRSTGGTGYGIGLIPSQFLMRRPGPLTDVGGLYLCGASTISGHGIAGTMMSGVLAAAKVVGPRLLNEVLRPLAVASTAKRQPQQASNAHS
ncbi:MAG: phytoene desaturase family protein [Burkholderiales bacterium]